MEGQEIVSLVQEKYRLNAFCRELASIPPSRTDHIGDFQRLGHLADSNVLHCVFRTEWLICGILAEKMGEIEFSGCRGLKRK